jgi:non-ribosomal peptide synthetase component E (peptide arylation enzyme)
MQFERVHHHVLADDYRAKGLWSGDTFFEILERRGREHPEREVFADAKRRITYGQLKDQVERCAKYLRSIGIKRGDVVTIQLPNWIEFPIAFLSLELIGAIANKVNPDFRSRELDYILRFSGSSAFICPREFKGFDYVTMAKSLRGVIPELKRVIVVGGAVEGTFDLADGIAISPPLMTKDRARTDPEEICRMAFTSGTTGDPKCVLHNFNTTVYPVSLINSDMEVTDKEVFLIYLPVGLNWGYILLMQTIMAGARAVLMERFSARGALETIEREHITFIATAPASIVAMLNDPKLEEFDVSSLRVVVTGGASAAIETIRDFRKRMKGHLVELYGMLESGFHSYTRFADDPEKVSGTIGRVVGDMELRIIDADGKDVPHGALGEIAARGPSVHLGYHNNPGANTQAFTPDGWFRTGDLGKFVDEQGNVQLTGRSKEIINRGGKKYFPREVEEILYTHPKILHAAIVGMPDPRLGEKNCLCFVPKPDQSLTLDEVVGFLKGEIADYKLPEMIEPFTELPLTGTGKIRRHILRDMVLERRKPG